MYFSVKIYILDIVRNLPYHSKFKMLFLTLKTWMKRFDVLKCKYFHFKLFLKPEFVIII